MRDARLELVSESQSVKEVSASMSLEMVDGSFVPMSYCSFFQELAMEHALLLQLVKEIFVVKS